MSSMQLANMHGHALREARDVGQICLAGNADTYREAAGKTTEAIRGSPPTAASRACVGNVRQRPRSRPWSTTTRFPPRPPRKRPRNETRPAPRIRVRDARMVLEAGTLSFTVRMEGRAPSPPGKVICELRAGPFGSRITKRPLAVVGVPASTMSTPVPGQSPRHFPTNARSLYTATSAPTALPSGSNWSAPMRRGSFASDGRGLWSPGYGSTCG